MLLFVCFLLQRTDSKAHSARFSKPKDEGWVLVAGNVDARELVALKRIGYIRGKHQVQLALFTPETTGRVIYTVYLMSDSYLGLDQQYDVCLDVLPRSLQAQINSEVEPVEMDGQGVRKAGDKDVELEVVDEDDNCGWGGEKVL